MLVFYYWGKAVQLFILSEGKANKNVFHSGVPYVWEAWNNSSVILVGTITHTIIVSMQFIVNIKYSSVKHT